MLSNTALADFFLKKHIHLMELRNTAASDLGTNGDGDGDTRQLTSDLDKIKKMKSIEVRDKH